MTLLSTAVQGGSGHRRRGRNISALLVWAVVSAVAAMAGTGVVKADDESNLMESVKAYFDAEMIADTSRIWAMLAPSSAFKREHSYHAYIEIAKQAKVRLKRYTIQKVEQIGENENRTEMPGVERIATVRVHVVLVDEKGHEWERTTLFTFLREGGKWYKG